MNKGVHDGLNKLGGKSSDNTYVGYWGDVRPFVGRDDMGILLLMQGQLNGGNPNTLLAAQPIYMAGGNSPGIISGGVESTPWMLAAVELPFDAEAVELTPVGVFHTSGTFSTVLVDIGVGPADNVTPVIEGFLLGSRQTTVQTGNTGGFGDTVGPFPVAIAAGSRVWVRYRVVGTAGFVRDQMASLVHFYCSYFGRSGNRAVTIPDYPTGATQVPTPGAIDTKGAYGSIGFLPFDTTWVVPCPVIAGNNTGYTQADWLVDYAYVERDGTVTIFAGDIAGNAQSDEKQWNLNRPYPVDLPAGTEIQARASFGNTTAQVNGFVAGLTCIGTDPSGGRQLHSARTGNPQTWPQ